MKARKPRSIVARRSVEPGDDIETLQDRDFADAVSLKSLFEYYGDMSRLLVARGWTLVPRRIGAVEVSEFQRDGVAIDSLRAFEIDRIGAATWEAYSAMEELHDIICSRRSRHGIRALRIAYYAGMCATEMATYRDAASGRGRPRRVDKIFAAITAAYESCRKRKPNTNPTAKDIYAFYRGPDVRNPAHFQNLVSRWRKLSSK